MDITSSSKYWGISNNKFEEEVRMLYGATVLISIIAIISALSLYYKQNARPALEPTTSYIPLSNSFGSIYLAGHNYKSCQSSASYPQIDRGVCKDGCTGANPDPTGQAGSANLTRLVLECGDGDAQNSANAEFASGLLPTTNNGMVIELIKREWSF